MSMSDREFFNGVSALFRLCNRVDDLHLERLLAEVNSSLDEVRLGRRSALEQQRAGIHNLEHVRELCKAARDFGAAVRKAKTESTDCVGGCCCG